MSPGNHSFSYYPVTANKVLFILNFMITSVNACSLCKPLFLILTNLIIIMGILRAARQRHQIAVAVVLQRENNSSRSATVPLCHSFFVCLNALNLPYSAIGLWVATGFIQTPGSVTNTNLIFCYGYFFFIEGHWLYGSHRLFLSITFV